MANVENVEKISDITVVSLAEYLRLAELTTEEESQLTTMLSVAKDYIKKYTGIPADELDDYTDLVIVVYVLVQDMYDNRTMYVDTSNSNKVVESILGLHQRNLL